MILCRLHSVERIVVRLQSACCWSGLPIGILISALPHWRSQVVGGLVVAWLVALFYCVFILCCTLLYFITAVIAMRGVALVSLWSFLDASLDCWDFSFMVVIPRGGHFLR